MPVSLLVKLFGKELEWTVSTTMLIVMLAQVVLVVAVLAVLILILVRKYTVRRRQNFLAPSQGTAAEAGAPDGLSLDLGAVRREFRVGDPFRCDGLAVFADYGVRREEVAGYTVEKPDLAVPGEATVVVRLGSLSASYTVTVLPAEERLPIGIALAVDGVKREFAAGEPFDATGLKVYINYNLEPFTEETEDFTVDPAPTGEEGTYYATVRAAGFFRDYPITVGAPRPRRPLGIELDLSAAKTDFTVGEPFDGTGLAVFALFEGGEREPADFTAEAPPFVRAGVYSATVRSGAFTETYPVFVTDPAPEEDETTEEGETSEAAEETSEETEESLESEGSEEDAGEEEGGESAAAAGYDKSFSARLILASDDTKQWYTVLKNELLSYRKVKSRMSWKRESFHAGRAAAAKFTFRGKTLCLALALDLSDAAGSGYEVETAEGKAFADTPCLFRIRDEEGREQAAELIALVMARLGLERAERAFEDYYLPYESIPELLEKGLVKPRGAAKEPPEALAAEGPEGGTLRYDRSFRAKVIQSDDATKQYYSAIKNDLLAYESVRARVSWKRETYKAGGDVVAKLGYRGGTLCLYLPLDASAYAGTRYKVEDVAANSSFADTPCMYRIKNAKRARLVPDLIAAVMRERGLNKRRRKEVDYTEPYRDIVRLISEGLARREIKSKDSESIFRKK